MRTPWLCRRALGSLRYRDEGPRSHPGETITALLEAALSLKDAPGIIPGADYGQSPTQCAYRLSTICADGPWTLGNRVSSETATPPVFGKEMHQPTVQVDRPAWYVVVGCGVSL